MRRRRHLPRSTSRSWTTRLPGGRAGRRTLPRRTSHRRACGTPRFRTESERRPASIRDALEPLWGSQLQSKFYGRRLAEPTWYRSSRRLHECPKGRARVPEKARSARYPRTEAVPPCRRGCLRQARVELPAERSVALRPRPADGKRHSATYRARGLHADHTQADRSFGTARLRTSRTRMTKRGPQRVLPDTRIRTRSWSE